MDEHRAIRAWHIEQPAPDLFRAVNQFGGFALRHRSWDDAKAQIDGYIAENPGDFLDEKDARHVPDPATFRCEACGVALVKREHPSPAHAAQGEWYDHPGDLNRPMVGHTLAGVAGVPV